MAVPPEIINGKVKTREALGTLFALGVLSLPALFDKPLVTVR